MKLIDLFEALDDSFNRLWVNNSYGRETVAEFIERNNIQVSSDGKASLYHGIPKTEDIDEIQSGSLLFASVDQAKHAAARYFKKNMHRDIKVAVLHLDADEFQPGTEIRLIVDHPVDGWIDA